MPLAAVVTGGQIRAADINQLINLLTGVMTDQPVTIGNTLAATALTPSGLTGSTAAVRLVGGTTTGAPTTGTHAVGDAIIAQDGFWWICTTAGTPGTWKLAGAALETATPAALNAGGTVGTSLNAAHGDHAHPSTGLGVLANAQTWAGKQTLGAGAALSGGTLDLQGQLLRLASTPAQGAYIVDDGTYLSFVAQTARSFYVQSSFGITYIYSPTIYLGDSTSTNYVHFRNATVDGNSWSMSPAGAFSPASIALGSGPLTKAYNASDSVPTLPSGAGARLWIQSGDPGASANAGDVWFGG